MWMASSSSHHLHIFFMEVEAPLARAFPLLSRAGEEVDNNYLREIPTLR